MLQTNLLLQKLGRAIIVITWVRVMVLALCTFSDDILSMYQVYLIPFYIFKRYVPEKLNIAKIRKASSSVNTGDRVMVLTFCDFPRGPLSVYQVPFNYLQYF